MNIRAEIFGGVKRSLLKEKQAKRTEARGLADVTIPRVETRRTNSRGKDRYRLSEQVVRVTYNGSSHEAEVVNVSGGGAMIACDLQPNLGECMQLHLGEGGGIECAVRWIKGGRLGLEFAHETQLHCSEDERSALLRDVIHRSFPHETFAREAQDEPAPSAPPRLEEHRIATRHPLIWMGELHHGTHSWTVRLRNISATGALVDCPGPLSVDAEVLLELDKAGAVLASVSWAVGDHVGLKFEQPFDLRRLSQAKPQVTPANWERPSYLEGQAEAGSPWDEAWRRLSVDDLRTQLEGFLKR
jgi:hypothetical protein